MFTSMQIWNAVDVLARRNGLSASRLSIMAGLDPTALNKSKRVGSDGRPRWMSTETIAKILSVTGTSLGDFVHMVDGHLSDAELHADIQSVGDRCLGSPPHILLVDQDEGFGARMQAGLAAAGFDTRVVGDFRRALQLIESGPPLDVLIANRLLPFGMHGAALARIARLRRPELKIVLLSGERAAVAEETEEEASLTLRKPFAEGRLVAELSRLLQC